MDLDDIKAEIAHEVAQRLLRMAVYFQAQHMQRLNKSAGPKSVKRTRNTAAGAKGSRHTIYTNPSKPGEYARKRTGFGQASVMLDTTDLGEIAQRQKIRVGYAQSAFYMGVLEIDMGRKGLLDTLKDITPQLNALAGKR